MLILRIGYSGLLCKVSVLLIHVSWNEHKGTDIPMKFQERMKPYYLVQEPIRPESSSLGFLRKVANFFLICLSVVHH